MRYFTLGETLVGALASTLYGASMGIVLRVIGILALIVKTAVLFPYCAVKYEASRTIRQCRDIPMTEQHSLRALGHVGEFVFVLIYGVGLLVLQYAFCDGAFRIYTLVLSVVSAVISYRTIGSAVGSVILKIYSFVYGFALKLVLIVMLPVKFICVKLSRLTAPVFKRIVEKIRNNRFASLCKLKERNVEKALMR